MNRLDGKDAVNYSGAVIGILLVGILAFLSWALVYVEVPDKNETAMNVLLGILSTQVGIVIGFHFGSSVNNKRLTDATASQAETIKAAQAALAPVVDTTVIPVASGEQVTVKADDPPVTP
jgi:hypothetical protein